MRAFVSANYFSKIFFPLYLIVGLFIFRDFGISWDEGINRIGTALPEFNYVFHGDQKTLLENSEKYHGPSFELLLLSAERIAHVTDTRSIYLLRHFITFFFFWLSSLFLFLLARKLFTRDLVAIACVLMYVLSPRIFGESFFNSKDIGCLSFFTISLYTLHRFISRKTLWNGFLHALVTGFMIDIRITGLIMPFVTTLAWIMEFTISRNRNIFSARQLFVFLTYVLLQILFIVIFWPVLWLNPVHHLQEAFAQMSNYPWTGNVIFMGEAMAAKNIPWYYLPLWMLISIPVLYSVLFIIGIVFCILKPLRLRQDNDPADQFVFVVTMLVLIPIAAVILLHSVVYDGWRHLYFVYAPFVVVAGYALEFICRKFKKAFQRRIIASVLCLQFLMVVFTIVSDHPLQYVYFNLPARLMLAPVTQNFDGDFWGISYRKGLECILEKDTSTLIHVRVENDPGIFNLEILPPEQRNRFSIHGELHECDYWLAEFRGRMINPDKVNAKIFDKIDNSSGRLLTIYKGIRNETAQEEIFNSEIDFEDTSISKRVTPLFFASGKFSQELNPNNSSSDPLYFTTANLGEEEVEEVQMHVLVNSEVYNPNTVIVLKVMRRDSLVYRSTESLQYRLNDPGDWTSFRWNVTLVPSDIREGDVVSAYVWNLDQSKVYVDDFKVAVLKLKVGKSVNYFPQ